MRTPVGNAAARPGVRGVLRCAAVALAVVLAGGAATAGAPEAHAQTIRDRQEWYFDLLRVREAQRISTGEGVVVGVVDSGVDASHPDLRGKVLPGKGVNGEAADGRSDRVAGHGTGMAGVIVGAGDGPNRVAGIAPGARVLPYAHGDDVRASTGAEGIRWAADNGARVLNLSWGVDARRPPPALVEAVEYALGKDVVVVASAGNLAGGSTEVSWPARVPGVIAVTGLGRDGRFWAEGSVRGAGAVLAAPAEDVVAPAPTVPSGYGKGSGTSSAAAIVSGVAAMVRAEFPDLDAAGVVERLVSTAVDEGPPGWDEQYGRGVVDPVAALTADVAPVDRNPLLPAPAEAPAPDPPVAGAPAGGGPAPGSPAVLPWLLVPVLVVLAALVPVLAARRRRRRPRVEPPPPWPGRAPPPRIPLPRGYDPPTQPHVPAQRPYRAAPPHRPPQPHGVPRRPGPPWP